LPVLQLKLHQVNVDGMGILRQVLDVPLLRCARSGNLSDWIIEMPSVNEHVKRIAGIESGVRAFLLVQGEELRVPNVWSWNEGGNRDQGGGQSLRMHSWRVLHRELHDYTRVRIGQI